MWLLGLPTYESTEERFPILLHFLTIFLYYTFGVRMFEYLLRIRGLIGQTVCKFMHDSQDRTQDFSKCGLWILLI